MSNTVTINMSLEDRGKTVQKKTQEVQGLNREFERTTKLASQALRTQPKAAGFAGEVTNYGVERGATGRTGASARDFANEAQGLGGLVRLYATYAANLFAASAAFNALSEAVNTSNMIKGLEQLGTSGGKNLTGLSKQFQEVTGFAISTREAIEATAKASSSGLSSEQFLKLGDVARQASQALGVNMSDAVSRLTRGITKLEPELLDELGIFTKVGTATEQYARSIGRSVNSLTDFERRQAFANAVLEEGIKKFGDIKLETNPYDRFLATLKDVGFEILNVVNMALKPLVSVLSESPTALLGIIGLIGTKIVSQALPALTEFRAKMQQTIEQSAVLAKTKAKEADASWKKFVELQKQQYISKIDVNPQAAEDYLEEVEKSAKANRYVNKEVKALIASKEISADWTEKEIQYLERLGRSNTKVSATYRDLALAIRSAQSENAKYAAQRAQKEQEASLAVPSPFSRAAQLQRQAESARRSSISSRSIADINRVFDTQGFTAAYQRLSDIQGRLDKLGTTTKWATNIQAGALLAARGISTLASGLFSFISGPLAAALVVLPILDLLFSKNSNEVAKFNSEIELAESSVDASIKTYEKFYSTVTVEASLARANSIKEITKSINDLTTSLGKAETKASWWDTFLNNLKKPLGLDLSSKYAEQLEGQIDALLKSIADPKLKKQIEKEFTKLMGAGSAGDAASRKAYIGLMSQEELKKFGQGVSDVAKTVDASIGQNIRILSNLREGFSSVEDKYKSLENSVVEKSVLGDFGLELIKQTNNISEALKDPYNMFSMLAEIMQDTSKIKFFDPQSQQALIDAAKQVQNLRIELEKAITSGDTNKESNVRAQINSIKLNLEGALKQSVVSGFKLLQSEASKIVSQASVSATKTLLGLLPQSEATIKAQLAADLRSIELKKAEISQRKLLIDTIARNSLRIEENTLLSRKTELEKEAASTTSEARRDAIVKEIDKVDLGLKAVRQETLLLETPGATPTNISQSPAAAERYRQYSQVNAQLTALDIESSTARTVAEVNVGKTRLDEGLKALQNQKALIDLKEREYKASLEFAKSSSEEQALRLEEFSRQKAAIDINNVAIEAGKDIVAAQLVLESKLGEKERSAAEQALKTAESAYILAVGRAQLAEKVRRDELSAANNKAAQDLIKSLQEQDLLTKAKRDTELQALDIQEQELSRSLELGAITENSYRLQLQQLAAKRTELELQNRLDSIAKETQSKLVEISEKLKNPNLGTKEREDLEAEAVKIGQYYGIATNGAIAWADAQTKANQVLTESQQRTKNFNEFGKNLFEGFGDAIVDFAQTGKWSFGDMVKSMIADLARLEMKMQMTKLYDASGGLGKLLGSVLPAVFGGSSYSGIGIDPTTITGADITAAYSRISQAKGGAFDSGLLKFAKGGAFTNQIVNTPTQFKFAQGAGIMGEAGPEAIMPLQRDNRGNLGVRAQGGGTKVDVVVNNYSSEKAEAKEVVDSRGNRRIEVTVGEMVAAEVSRSNSPVNQSIKNSFGTKPALIRR